MHKYIGREPSGRTYNELALNADSKPYNPFVRSGAIMAAALIKPDQSIDRVRESGCTLVAKPKTSRPLIPQGSIALGARHAAFRILARRVAGADGRPAPTQALVTDQDQEPPQLRTRLHDGTRRGESRPNEPPLIVSRGVNHRVTRARFLKEPTSRPRSHFIPCCRRWN